jgi:hypothetical protein
VTVAAEIPTDVEALDLALLERLSERAEFARLWLEDEAACRGLPERLERQAAAFWRGGPSAIMRSVKATRRGLLAMALGPSLPRPGESGEDCGCCPWPGEAARCRHELPPVEPSAEEVALLARRAKIVDR